jgi:YopJ Serine/Threonine acetyltransferase
MTSILRVPRAPHLDTTSQGVDTSAPVPAESRRRPLPEADAAIGRPSRRQRSSSAAQGATRAPRSLPKAKAKALDAALGPIFDREAAAQSSRPEIAGLASYLNELENAYRENRAPAVNDIKHLGLIVDGLNMADPGLNLVFDQVMEDELSDWVEKYKLTERLLQGLGKGDAWRMVVDDGTIDHRYALSVQCSASSNDASLILVDGLEEESEVSMRITSWSNILGSIGEVLRERMPAADPPIRLHLDVACTTTQRTAEGCDIHALSAARKMAAEPEFAQLHATALHAMVDGPTGESFAALPATDLPPSFFKHSSSGMDLVDNLLKRDEAGRDPVVNRGGQTLLERWTSHMTHRWDAEKGKERWYSNSYEAKRIDLIRTALAALVPPPTL